MCSTLFFVMTVVFLIGIPENQSFPFPPGEIDWPIDCNGKTYCHIKPTNYPDKHVEKLLETMSLEPSQFSDLGNRSSEEPGTDVASCAFRARFDPIYLIKDEYDRVRIVPQRKNHLVLIRIEECRNPGRVFHAPNLKTDALSEHRVDCLETRFSVDVPVLSVNGRKILFL